MSVATFSSQASARMPACHAATNRSDLDCGVSAEDARYDRGHAHSRRHTRHLCAPRAGGSGPSTRCKRGSSRLLTFGLAEAKLQPFFASRDLRWTIVKMRSRSHREISASFSDFARANHARLWKSGQTWAPCAPERHRFFFHPLRWPFMRHVLRFRSCAISGGVRLPALRRLRNDSLSGIGTSSRCSDRLLISSMSLPKTLLFFSTIRIARGSPNGLCRIIFLSDPFTIAFGSL